MYRVLLRPTFEDPPAFGDALREGLRRDRQRDQDRQFDRAAGIVSQALEFHPLLLDRPVDHAAPPDPEEDTPSAGPVLRPTEEEAARFRAEETAAEEARRNAEAERTRVAANERAREPTGQSPMYLQVYHGVTRKL